MSGFALLLRTDGAVADPDLVAKVTERLRNPGRDGEVCWQMGPIAVRVRQIHATPEAADAPFPAPSSCGRYSVLWDGRLDNRDDLLQWLEARGRTHQRDVYDGRIAADLFAEAGVACFDRMLGDFAVAVWDNLDQTLTCARDPVGARPFYYTHQAGFFAIASEDEALTALPGVSSEWHLDRQIYALNPWFSAFDWSQSWSRDVRILMPGWWLKIGVNGKFDHLQYWKWEPGEPARFASDEEALEAFAEVLERAVAARTRGLDRIGVICSGGIDSATVAVSASRVAAGRRIWQYSTLRDDTDTCIESNCIRSIAASLGTEQRFFYVPSFTGVCSRADVENYYQVRHPTDDSISLVGMMCLAAARDGHRVALHGVSGDLALWAPDDYLVQFARERGWRAAWRESALAKKNHTYIAGRSRALSWLRSFYEEFAPPAIKTAWRKARWARAIEFPSASPLHPARTSSPGQIALRQLSHERARLQHCHSQQYRSVQSHVDVISPIGIVRGLEGYQRVASRYGLELRDPLSDRQILSFCLTIAMSLKTNAGWTKWPLRRYCLRSLPASVSWNQSKDHLGWLVAFPYLDSGPLSA